MQQHIRIGRAEVLIAPADTLAECDVSALARCVGQTLDAPTYRYLACGSYGAVVLSKTGLEPAGGPRPAHDIKLSEGLWPEPLGLRLAVWPAPPNAAWSLESDRFGVRPIFYGFDGRQRPIASTRPELVATLVGGRLSERSVAEHLLVGFSLDDHSPFDGVFRLRPRERLTHTEAQGFRMMGKPREEPEDPATEWTVDGWVHALTPVIARAFEHGAALELSGGVDSRLVLALGLHGGVKPRFAFTLGRYEDEDVRIARRICERFGLEHLALPVEIDESWISADGREFVRRAGFEVNACSYAWLPHVFERLSRVRSVQIGGGGGECAGGFYDSPLDALCAARSIQPWWVRMRLLQRGVSAAALFGKARARALTTEIADAALARLRAGAGGWRRRTDEFYLDQRVPNAGGPVLSASACWYEPLQPLLHGPYVEWGRHQRTSRRAHRRVQMKIIDELAPELGRLPYSDNRRFATVGIAKLAQRLHNLRSTGLKIRERMAGHRGTPDLGAQSVSAVLLRDESVLSLVHTLCSTMNLCRENIERMIAAPAACERELGTLITAAWAAESARTVARELWAARPQLRLAA